MLPIVLMVKCWKIRYDKRFHSRAIDNSNKLVISPDYLNYQRFLGDFS